MASYHAEKSFTHLVFFSISIRCKEFKNVYRIEINTMNCKLNSTANLAHAVEPSSFQPNLALPSKRASSISFFCILLPLP